MRAADAQQEVGAEGVYDMWFKAETSQQRRRVAQQYINENATAGMNDCAREVAHSGFSSAAGLRRSETLCPEVRLVTPGILRKRSPTSCSRSEEHRYIHKSSD
jgi:hypothetical protein